ncbi:MAG: tripartite tricarboxylate transporter substrate binding protein [Hyphomicrobiales bacterium]|nr:tripartite tricarboxylate transporter substrate binding protein [Hyphomicrobiales bacterium]
MRDLAHFTRRGLGLAAAALALAAFAPTGATAGDVEKLHFLIPGGAGGGWDGTARGTGEALTKSGMVKGASYENLSGGGGGKAIAHIIETKDRQAGTLMVNSTPIVLRSLRGRFPQSFRDLTPIAGTIGDFGAFVVPADSPYKSFADVAKAFQEDNRKVKVAGGSVKGGMDHLVASLTFQAYGADPSKVRYISYDAGGKAMAGLLSGETKLLSTGLGEALEQARAGQVRVLCITSKEAVEGIPPCGHGVEFVNWRGFFGAPGLDPKLADAYAKMLGDVQKTDAWETVRKRNGWVNIYRSRAEFVAFLEEQEKAMKALFQKLGIKTVR